MHKGKSHTYFKNTGSTFESQENILMEWINDYKMEIILCIYIVSKKFVDTLFGNCEDITACKCQSN